MKSKPAVSIIIPTALDERRAKSLETAVLSVRQNKSVDAVPVIVANGRARDSRAFANWKRDPRIRFYYIEEPNPAAAVRHGRQHVDTPYFGFLDDDDYYLPGALDVRVTEIERESDSKSGHDVVVTNGWLESRTGRKPCFERLEQFNGDPLTALPGTNWLASCAGLYRTATVGPDFFDGSVRYMEWTVTAYRLALNCRILFSDQRTFVINDTENSLSKSTDYKRGVVDAFRVILSLPLPSHIRAVVQHKYAFALHGLSSSALARGAINEAWNAHWRCLLQPGGLRFLGYSRHIAAASWRSLNR